MLQLIQLRWTAVIGQIVTILVVAYGYRIALPLGHMLTVLACLIGFNLFSLLRWRAANDVANSEVLVALLVDVGTLTAQLYFTGGTANPFIFLYLLQVILAAILLRPLYTWAIVIITCICFAGLSIYSEPLALPVDHDRGISNLYVQGILICFALNASLLVFFITRINRNLRARDSRLADLRQRAAEEEHIVRMGLLASGAAHELGSPLATLSVILGDWMHMPAVLKNADLRSDVKEMTTQLQRCKTIVSGILLSAGEARGESSVETTINTFLDDLAHEWRNTRTIGEFAYHNRFAPDLPVVFDSALKQMINNVLDNALDASPHWLSLEADREDEQLLLTVTDKGPGFSQEMMKNFGKPYHSTKGRPGGGLGLFLVVNVARTLGGAVHAYNRPGGGAVVKLTLPLSAIKLREDD